MPGWRAERDGRPTLCYAAYGALLAVDVPSGKSRVTFEYEPPMETPGRIVTMLGLFVTGALFGYAAAQRKMRAAA